LQTPCFDKYLINIIPSNPKKAEGKDLCTHVYSHVLLVSKCKWDQLRQPFVSIPPQQERYNTRLDLNALGHASPLAATTTLLWEVRWVAAVENDRFEAQNRRSHEFCGSSFCMRYSWDTAF